MTTNPTTPQTKEPKGVGLDDDIWRLKEQGHAIAPVVLADVGSIGRSIGCQLKKTGVSIFGRSYELHG